MYCLLFNHRLMLSHTNQLIYQMIHNPSKWRFVQIAIVILYWISKAAPTSTMIKWTNTVKNWSKHQVWMHKVSSISCQLYQMILCASNPYSRMPKTKHLLLFKRLITTQMVYTLLQKRCTMYLNSLLVHSDMCMRVTSQRSEYLAHSSRCYMRASAHIAKTQNCQYSHIFIDTSTDIKCS